jgi:hypothetical protein
MNRGVSIFVTVARVFAPAMAEFLLFTIQASRQLQGVNPRAHGGEAGKTIV